MMSLCDSGTYCCKAQETARGWASGFLCTKPGVLGISLALELWPAASFAWPGAWAVALSQDPSSLPPPWSTPLPALSSRQVVLVGLSRVCRGFISGFSWCWEARPLSPWRKPHEARQASLGLGQTQAHIAFGRERKPLAHLCGALRSPGHGDTT